jgi:predicted transcriptional regulator
MAMTVSFDDEELAALRRRAELEGRSTCDIVRQAVRDYLQRASKQDRLNRALNDGLVRYADVFERLGE